MFDRRNDHSFLDHADRMIAKDRSKFFRPVYIGWAITGVFGILFAIGAIGYNKKLLDECIAAGNKEYQCVSMLNQPAYDARYMRNNRPGAF